uniref:Uncharacterized protein n=1 Tax=Rhizophora mucronata TaxID=61149 RepID=A0A2P2IHV4_RHIMU
MRSCRYVFNIKKIYKKSFYIYVIGKKESYNKFFSYSGSFGLDNNVTKPE